MAEARKCACLIALAIPTNTCSTLTCITSLHRWTLNKWTLWPSRQRSALQKVVAYMWVLNLCFFI